MATHSSILAWRIPWTEEPGGLHGAAESDMTKWLSACRHTHTHTHTHARTRTHSAFSQWWDFSIETASGEYI